MRKRCWNFLFSLFLLFSLTINVRGAMERPKNIILIGWDGAQRNHVKECLSRNELPNLKALSNEGTLVAIDAMRTTDTKAGWSQILTGYMPEVTGVFSNNRYQPIPKGLTIFERLEEYFGKDNFVTVAVIGKKGNVDADGPVKIEITSKKEARFKEKAKKAGGKIIEENGTKYYVEPGKPYYNAYTALDIWVNGLMENKVVGSKAIEYIEKYKDKPFFFFVHFAEVDHSGHAHGENSKEYNDALISNDFWTGKIMEKLKELKLYNNTLIYVTADHGFDEGQNGHADAPYVFLATNDKGVVRRGYREDIAPTIYDRLGIDLSKFNPPLDGESLLKPAKNQANW